MTTSAHSGIGKQRKGKGPATRRKRTATRERLEREKLEELRRRREKLR